MKFRFINSIPRIVFSYKSFSTNGQRAWKQFAFPTRPYTILVFLSSLLLGENIVCKDELGILMSHDEIYKEDDIILAIGVGSGISLIHNSSKKRNNNSFIGIEGSTIQIEIAKANAKLNEIDFSKFKLLEGFAGNPTHIYGKFNKQFTNIIDINKMKFDVLELDCEGSEIEILNDLSVRPRHIIVEMHPMYRDINITKFLEEMKSKGYSIRKIYKVNGDSDDLNDIDVYFTNEFIEKMFTNDKNWKDGLLVISFHIK